MSGRPTRKTPGITPTKLAARLGVTEQAVRSAMAKGRLSVRSDGKLDPQLAMREWEQNRRGQPGPGRPRKSGPTRTPQSRAAEGETSTRGAKEQPPPLETLLEAQTRKEVALADLREMDAAKRRGELLEASAVARDRMEEYRRLRSAILATPSRIRARLPHLTTEEATVIDRELRDALAALGEGRDLEGVDGDA